MNDGGCLFVLPAPQPIRGAGPLKSTAAAKRCVKSTSLVGSGFYPGRDGFARSQHAQTQLVSSLTFSLFPREMSPAKSPTSAC